MGDVGVDSTRSRMTEVVGVPVPGSSATMASTFAQGDPRLPPLVFVHGMSLNGTAGREFSRFFSGRGHSVVTFDLPGHGGSDPLPPDEVFMARFGELFWEILEHWQVSGPVLGCGHSAGGMTVLQAAVQCPQRMSALLLISTPDVQPIRANEEIDLRPAVQIMMSDSERLFVERKRVDFFASADAIADRDAYLLGMAHTDPTGVKQVFEAAESYDVRTQLEQLNMPALLVRGVDDVILHADTVARMVRGLGRGRSVSMPGGHRWFLEHPEALQRCLEEHYDFLTGATERDPGRQP